MLDMSWILVSLWLLQPVCCCSNVIFQSLWMLCNCWRCHYCQLNPTHKNLFTKDHDVICIVILMSIYQSVTLGKQSHHYLQACQKCKMPNFKYDLWARNWATCTFTSSSGTSYKYWRMKITAVNYYNISIFHNIITYCIAAFRYLNHLWKALNILCVQIYEYMLIYTFT